MYSDVEQETEAFIQMFILATGLLAV